MTSQETIEQRYEEAIRLAEQSENPLDQSKVQMSKSAIDLQHSLCQKEHVAVLQVLECRYAKKQEQLREWKEQEDRKVKRKISEITAQREAKIRNLKWQFVLHNRKKPESN